MSAARAARTRWLPGSLRSIPLRQGLFAAELKVAGLKGGHSGLEIDKNRGNSIKIITRVLIALSDMGVRLASIEGGNKHNAIPREAEALVCVPKKKWDDAVKLVAACQDVVRAELGTVDPDLRDHADRKEGEEGQGHEEGPPEEGAADPRGAARMA